MPCIQRQATLLDLKHKYLSVTFVNRHTEIGDKYGPFDLAMIPIWRGASLSFLGRFGLRVRASSLRHAVLYRPSCFNLP